MVDESESKQSVTDKQEDTIERSSATSTAHLMSLNSRRSTNLWSRTMRCWYECLRRGEQAVICGRHLPTGVQRPWLCVGNENHIAGMSAELVAHGLAPIDLEVRRASLEDVFLTITGGEH